MSCGAIATCCGELDTLAELPEVVELAVFPVLEVVFVFELPPVDTMTICWAWGASAAAAALVVATFVAACSAAFVTCLVTSSTRCSSSDSRTTDNGQ